MAEKKGKLDQVLSKLDRVENALTEQAKKFLEYGEMFRKMDVKIDQKFDQVLTGLDKVIGELGKICEDRIEAVVGIKNS